MERRIEELREVVGGEGQGEGGGRGGGGGYGDDGGLWEQPDKSNRTVCTTCAAVRSDTGDVQTSTALQN